MTSLVTPLPVSRTSSQRAARAGPCGVLSLHLLADPQLQHERRLRRRPVLEGPDLLLTVGLPRPRLRVAGAVSTRVAYSRTDVRFEQERDP
jgi:hypothetical protein